VREAVEAFRPQLPAGVTLFFSQDSSFFAEKQVVELQGNLVPALVLVLVCLLPLLRLRHSLIVAAGIPVSLLFSLILLWLLGYSFNFMVMFGMLLGLGLLIDGAIVVVEEADRQINAGAPRAMPTPQRPSGCFSRSLRQPPPPWPHSCRCCSGPAWPGNS